MRKSKAVKSLQAPNPRDVELVINQARQGPLKNLDHAKAVDAALAAVTKFFEAIYVQANRQPSAPVNSDATPPAGK